MSGGQHVRRRHFRDSGLGAGGAVSRESHGIPYLPVPTSDLYGSQLDLEAISMPDIPADVIDGSTHILPGSVPATTFDATPPAVPTGLMLTSELAQQVDGSLLLRLVAELTQPADTDLYGSWVQITARESAPGVPDWDRPITALIGATQSRATVEGVAGGTLYYARAYAVDVQGNVSAFTSVVSHTTLADSIAPSIPQGVVAVAGFRGVSLSWVPTAADDLSFHEIRVAVDDGTGLAPDVNQWQYIRIRTNAVWIGDLSPDQLYWLQARAVDRSGNVETSDVDPTAVNYLLFPEAGWSSLVSATPTLVGSADIAANSVTADHIIAGSLDADDIGAGTLTIRPTAGFAEGIRVLNGSGVELGLWDELGIKITDPANASRYVLIDAGQVKFTQDGGVTFPAAITPDGINASAINFGSVPGGHNLILNSSFELGEFVAAASQFIFTDTTNWTAANRVTAPVNITEGTDLQMTTPGYV